MGDVVSTGSGSDRVAIPAISILAIKGDPVATAPGTDLIYQVGTLTPASKATCLLLRTRRLSYIITRMEATGKYSFTMLFEPAEEGGYVVTCPALPGLVTEGDTMEDARRMAEDALRGYLESLLEDGLSIPA